MWMGFNFQTNLAYNHRGDNIDTTFTIDYHFTISLSNLSECVKNVGTLSVIANLR